jgi:FtsP/CotA-like multicopper oxidase with cupredoxin domain
VWTEEFAKLDGVDHLVHAVNGVFPLPVVRVWPGEEVEITVVNKLSSQSMSIH